MLHNSNHELDSRRERFVVSNLLRYFQEELQGHYSLVIKLSMLVGSGAGKVGFPKLFSWFVCFTANGLKNFTLNLTTTTALATTTPKSYRVFIFKNIQAMKSKVARLDHNSI